MKKPKEPNFRTDPPIDGVTLFFAILFLILIFFLSGWLSMSEQRGEVKHIDYLTELQTEE